MVPLTDMGGALPLTSGSIRYDVGGIYSSTGRGAILQMNVPKPSLTQTNEILGVRENVTNTQEIIEMFWIFDYNGDDVGLCISQYSRVIIYSINV